MLLDSIDSLQEALYKQTYIADRGLATSVYLALKLQRPLLLEGEPGVGKTEVAKVIANLLETQLIRLQCYEGLDISQAVYEWNYARQIMHIRAAEGQHSEAQHSEAQQHSEVQHTAFDEDELFSERFLLRRPRLRAIEESKEKPCVLL